MSFQNFTPDIRSFLATGAAVHTEHLLLTWPRDRVTNAEQFRGFWSGAGAIAYTVDGVARTFAGDGAYVRPAPANDAVIYEPGLVVQYHSVQLAGGVTAVREAYETLRPDGMRAELWLAVHRASDGTLVDVWRVWKGTEHEMTRTVAPRGQPTLWTISIASSARDLSRPLHLRRSERRCAAWPRPMRAGNSGRRRVIKTRGRDETG